MRFGIILVVLLATILSTAGCSTSTATQEQADDTQEAPAAAIGPVIADENMGNLQLDQSDRPVYDAYLRQERHDKGLVQSIPDLMPYKPAGEKIAYLTFDDGPDDVNTPAVLAVLKENDVKATFYLLGKSAKAYPDVVKQIYEMGCAIGNHSYDHDYGRLYQSPVAYIKEMDETDAILKSILGVRPLITRAPGGVAGHFNKHYWDTLKKYGYAEHDWNISSADAAPNHPVAQDFIDNIQSQVESDYAPSSAIILMHSSSGHEETVKALPTIIRVLREHGYHFGVITPMTPQPW
ncbi:MAG: polysaccharide deacetylase [Selenomonas sp.]|nr:polysaccharide deacetylase [Selenomonas sp.]